jgi:hypothetical protein
LWPEVVDRPKSSKGKKYFLIGLLEGKTQGIPLKTPKKQFFARGWAGFDRIRPIIETWALLDNPLEVSNRHQIYIMSIVHAYPHPLPLYTYT